MEKEPRKFLVILRPGSAAAQIFEGAADVISSGMPALACSEMDLSGMHARVKRIPVASSKSAKSGVREQVLWIAAQDIALAVEYTGSESHAGFGS